MKRLATLGDKILPEKKCNPRLILDTIGIIYFFFLMQILLSDVPKIKIHDCFARISVKLEGGIRN